ncbi:sensor histidine kinase [Zoogloea dura]|nr:histidine kinase dimerization/phosphoacceptor domain -containing protein [Zoogloea dura]
MPGGPTRALLDMMMQDRHYGGLVTGPDGRILEVLGNAAGLLKQAPIDLIGCMLDAVVDLGAAPPCPDGRGQTRPTPAHGTGTLLNYQHLASGQAGTRITVLQALPSDACTLTTPAAEALFHGMQYSTQAMLWVSDPALKTFLYASPGFAHLWGHPADVAPAPAIWRDAVLPKDLPRVETFIAAQQAGRISNTEVRIRHQDGSVRWLWAHSCPWLDRQRQARVTGFVLDITTLRTDGTPPDASWEILLREGHHRIKNSLQALAALLRRHADSAGDHREILTEAVGQIRSIAAVHELYSQDGQPRASLDALLATLSRSAEGLYPGRPAIEIAPLPVIAAAPLAEPDIQPLAVMLNELLTNALKHGHSAATGTIRISIAVEGEYYVLRIDNPGRLPADFDFGQGRGLGSGLQLLAALADPPDIVLDVFQGGPDTVRARLSLHARRIPCPKEAPPHAR